jgi:hypothetical protein
MKGHIIDMCFDRENKVYRAVNDTGLVAREYGSQTSMLQEAYSSGQLPGKGLHVDVRV